MRVSEEVSDFEKNQTRCMTEEGICQMLRLFLQEIRRAV